MLSLREAHFSSLPSQSNVYGLSTLPTKKTASKVLIASLKRKVFCVEYAKNQNLWRPSTREVQFTYIPSSAEIISIDSFNRSSNDHDFIVGITFIKSGESLSGQYLNIYSDWEPGGECILDNIAQGCLTIELDFVPYRITHAPLCTPTTKETVLLLGGSDKKIHVYREDPVSQLFTEWSSSECFPEFDNLPSIAYGIQVKQIDSTRISAVGCENGVVRVSVVDTAKTEPSVLRLFEVQHDSPISVVELFCDKNVYPCPDFIKTVISVPTGTRRDDDVHLLVGSMLEKAVVYRDILKNEFREPKYLPNSEKYDCVTTACIADIDFDGKTEVLIGTYGQELLAYKWNCVDDRYGVIWQRSFSDPLHALSYMDLMGDGVKELLVLSTKGLHILQYSPEEIAELCRKRIAFFEETLVKH